MHYCQKIVKTYLFNNLESRINSDKIAIVEERRKEYFGEADRWRGIRL